MKNIFKTILTVPLALSFLLMGTACEYEVTKRTKKGGQTDDSDEIVIDNYIATDKTLYEYNDLGQLTKDTSYRWNMETKSWEGTWMNEFIYKNGDDQWYQQLQYQWNSFEQEWRPEFRYVFNEDEPSHYYYSWSSETNDWIVTGKQESIMDEEGIPIREECFTWSNEINDFVLDGKGIYAYDERQATSSIEWSRLNEHNEWVNNRKTEYEYSEDWLIWSISEYTWHNGEWQKDFKDTYERNSDELDISLTHYNWSYELNDWKEDRKEVYEYDNDKKRILELRYSWSDLDNDFIESGKAVYKYNEKGEKTHFVIFIKQDIYD